MKNLITLARCNSMANNIWKTYVSKRFCMRSFFLFMCIIIQNIYPVFCMDDILVGSQGNKYPWVSGMFFDYRLLDVIYETASEKASTTSYFCQIRHADPNKINLYSFGLVSELTSEKTGKKHYFTEAFVYIDVQHNKIITEVHPYGISENGNKIQRLKKYLEKLSSKPIVCHEERRAIRIRDLEELMHLIKGKPKSISWNIFGLSF